MAACRVGVLTYPEVSHKGENLTSGSLATPEHPRSGINKPGLSGDTPSRTAKAGASLIAAEVVKYAVFNLALAIITPLVALLITSWRLKEGVRLLKSDSVSSSFSRREMRRRWSLECSVFPGQ